MSSVYFGPFQGEVQISKGKGTLVITHVKNPRKVIERLPIPHLTLIEGHLVISELGAQKILADWLMKGRGNLIQDLARFIGKTGALEAQ